MLSADEVNMMDIMNAMRKTGDSDGGGGGGTDGIGGRAAGG